MGKMRLGFFSVKTKIILIIVVILFLSVGVNTLSNSLIFTREYSDALQSKGFAIGDTLNYQLNKLLALGIPLDNIVGFEKQCREIVYRHRDISYASVVDMDGVILFHNDLSLQGKRVNDEYLSDIKSESRGFKISPEAQEYKLFIPVMDVYNKHVGTIVLGIPLEVIKEKTNGIIINSVVLMVLSFILAVLISLLLAKSITEPLRELTEGSRAISKGYLDYEIDVKSKDEIGELGRTFNDMRVGLKDRNDLLNSLLKTFEGKFGNIATILVRKDVNDIIRRNPRIEKILPISIKSALKKQTSVRRKRGR